MKVRSWRVGLINLDLEFASNTLRRKGTREVGPHWEKWLRPCLGSSIGTSSAALAFSPVFRGHFLRSIRTSSSLDSVGRVGPKLGAFSTQEDPRRPDAFAPRVSRDQGRIYDLTTHLEWSFSWFEAVHQIRRFRLNTSYALALLKLVTPPYFTVNTWGYFKLSALKMFSFLRRICTTRDWLKNIHLIVAFQGLSWTNHRNKNMYRVRSATMACFRRVIRAWWANCRFPMVLCEMEDGFFNGMFMPLWL